MATILSALISLLSFRLRSRASLELELIALRHQVTVLRRQRSAHSSGPPKLFSMDRLLWVWLYWLWPQALDAIVLVKPATVGLPPETAQHNYPEMTGIHRLLERYCL